MTKNCWASSQFRPRLTRERELNLSRGLIFVINNQRFKFLCGISFSNSTRNWNCLLNNNFQLTPAASGSMAIVTSISSLVTSRTLAAEFTQKADSVQSRFACSPIGIGKGNSLPKISCSNFRQGNSSFGFSNNFSSRSSYNNNKIYRRLDRCLVIPPLNGKKPRAIIKFLGGAFLGAAPELTYRFHSSFHLPFLYSLVSII